MKTKLLSIRVTEKDAAEFMRIARLLDIPFSQIARDAIRERLARLKKKTERADAQ